jgi:hypothetical protein
MLFADQVIALTESLETDRTHCRLVDQLEAAATSMPVKSAK